MKSVLPAVALAAAAFTGGALAETPFQVSWTRGAGTTWNADWIGVAPHRTYFAQVSEDLIHWEFLPVLEFGEGLKGVGFDNGGLSQHFFRLMYADEAWVTSEQQARDADFDSDGIPNGFEVEAIGSNPLDKNSAGGDSNSNSLPDGWELFHFGGLGVANPNVALKPDGLTNKEKAELGLNPHVDYSSSATSQPAAYTYDLAGRLTGVTAPVAAVAFTLDAEGNITNAQ